ncbi:threonine synthase, partial [Candidatus Pacearchaeota archaeon]|nr:threonine synthase [Candidatus Pacearchaeota archaeon]
VAKYVGMPASKLYLQFEGDNPTGSFKDNGMAAGFTHARMLKKRNVVCASTGNTSASMAAFAANELDMRAYVFIGSGKIAMGKLAQTLEYGARVIQIRGDFDDAMAKVQELAVSQGLYIMNSVNPFRLEGQKTIMYRMLEGLNWQVPDWVVVPGGNLGNASAFGKAFHELHEMGMIKRTPNLAIINARGANTLSQLVNEHHVSWNQGEPDTDTIRRFYNRMNAENQRAHTIASAIEINRPVNLLKALRALEWTKGIVREVEDREMLDAKAVIGRNGFGCEPASAATVAGIKLLVEEGVINPGETVVGILTGHQLKDPVAAINYHTGKNKYSNQPHEVDNTAEAIIGALD